MPAFLEWLKSVDPALLALEERPQFGPSAPFPKEALQSLLERLFGKEGLKLDIHNKGWQAADKLWEGLGENLLSLTVDMTPLEEPTYFVMSEQDLKELMGEVLGGDSALAPFYENALTEGFYHYLALEVMHAIEQVGFASPLSPRLAASGGDLKGILADRPCYIFDASCQFNDQTIWGRLLVPEPFRRAWKDHFAASSDATLLDPKLKVDVSVVIGGSELTFEELKRAKVGDVILLDSCSYDLEARRGSATVQAGDQPLFRGKFKDMGVELLEFPFEELGEAMAEEEEGFEEEEEFEEEEFEEEAVEEEAAEPAAPPPTEPPKMDVANLPVVMTIEVARLKMTLQELSGLSPGALLELSATPDAGVTLVVNGKRSGRGELVKAGEGVGVRIISI